MITRGIYDLKELYEKACRMYIRLFVHKQNLEFSGWVGNRVGEVALFGDIYINFRDVKYDIDNGIEAGKIITWYDYNIDKEENFNYESYLKLNP